MAKTREEQAADADDRDYLFQERAAIMEFDGGMTRKEAESLARIDVREVMERRRKGGK